MHKPGLIAAVSLLPAIALAVDLLKNGDFEDGRGNPPDGWVMWGADEFKIPQNYAIDTSTAKNGKASFRIHHPRGTAGYVISNPHTNAIRPNKGECYTISFSAKSDTDTPASLRLSSYRSVRPIVQGPGIATHKLAVSSEWKDFSFTIQEGKDFVADACRHIYLAFSASASQEDEKTLWLDDVTVTRATVMNDGSPSLIDDTAVAYDPLPLRLKPGTVIKVRLDARRRLHRANRFVGGVSFHRVSGFTGQPYSSDGRYTLPRALEEGIRELRLPVTRFYAVGDETYPLEESIDKVAEVIGKANIPQETTVLEFEDQGANRALSPQRWAEGVAHSMKKGYRFCHWEIGNETYSVTFVSDRPHGGAFPTPDHYISHFMEVSAAIKRVQPQGRIGLSVNMANLKWGNYILSKTAGSYDFVVPHWYGGIVQDSFEETVLAGNHQKLSRALQVNALLRHYNKQKPVFQLDTEWGLHAPGPEGKKADYNLQNGNIFGTIYRAVRLLYYMRENVVQAATSWQLLSNASGPGFGVLFAPPNDNSRSMIYWLHYYFNRHTGDWVLQTDGAAPYYESSLVKLPNQTTASFSVPITPVAATLSQDGNTMYIMLVNGSWTKVFPCEASIDNFKVGTAEGVVLSNADMNAHPLVDKKDNFVSALKMSVGRSGLAFNLPEHSIVFITLRQ